MVFYSLSNSQSSRTLDEIKEKVLTFSPIRYSNGLSDSVG